MSAACNLLAIDLGAESGRAIQGRLDGHRLELSEVHRFANRPARLPDGLHWDVLHLWQEIQYGIAAGSSAAGGQGLAGIGVDAWGVDFALLDRQGGLLGAPYHYRDNRTDGMLALAFRQVPRRQIFETTGIQFMQINSLYQLLSMAAADAPALHIAQTFLTIPDLFNFWLTGEKVCEFTNATTTQCLDPRRRDWAHSLLESLGIPARIFPLLVQPGTLLGPLRAELAADLGTGPLPVLAPACHDTGSAVVAVPAESPSFAWISSGTWSIMGAEASQPVINPQTLDFNFTNEGGVFGTWRLSKNIMGLWLVQECKRTWERQGSPLSYAELTQLAADAEPFLAVIDPDAPEFFKPGDMPERIRAYCRRTRQPQPESKGQVVRAALEGLALKSRWVLERLENILGTRLDVIHLIGGGTRNQLLCQYTADAAGRLCIAGPVEATAIGNLLIQAIGLGQLADLSEARAVVRHSFTPEIYQPQPGQGWQDAFARLLALMEMNND